MLTFEKYQHVERINSPETDGLLDGICHVFPKIDGTNASIWYDKEKGIMTGSRNRELSLESDNAGFCRWVYEQTEIPFDEFFGQYDHLRLYGEWLVPHSLKTYRDEAWRDFYVFDVMDGDMYIQYDVYKPLLEQYGINYIPPLATIKNPSGDDLLRLLDRSGEFLVKNGAGKGEGIVVKNYDFVNKFGRTTWGKMVTNEFKEIHNKEMGAPLINGTLLVEEQIVRDFLTDAFIEKEQMKISVSHDPEGEIGWQMKYIPELLGRVWYEFVREETPNFVKKFKNPKVDFNLLQRMVQRETKRVIGL